MAASFSKRRRDENICPITSAPTPKAGCRIQHPNAMFVAGLSRRIGNSLLMEWRSHQRCHHPEFLTTTDFQTAMGEDHCESAVRLLFAKRPSVKPPKK